MHILSLYPILLSYLHLIQAVHYLSDTILQACLRSNIGSTYSLSKLVFNFKILLKAKHTNVEGLFHVIVYLLSKFQAFYKQGMNNCRISGNCGNPDLQTHMVNNLGSIKGSSKDGVNNFIYLKPFHQTTPP